MNNLWTKLNEDIPKYMEGVCDKYHLQCIKISDLKSALVGKNFALVISIDRFGVDISYYLSEENKLLMCNNFFAEKFNSDDRKNLIDGTGADIIIKNNLIVISNGMQSKWNNVLDGEQSWIEKYRKSKWYELGKLSENETEIILKHLKILQVNMD